MLKRRILTILLLTALFIFPAACAGGEQKNYTVMVYMCGSDLETMGGAASQDIDEMIDTAFDSQAVNLLIMTGGARRWNNSFPSDAHWICRLEPGVFPVHEKEETLASMGEAGTLASFLQYGISRYPADHYALILWDHGAGPLGGVCLDDVFHPDRLTLNELTEALKQADLPQKLEWIGFDACLMSSVEVSSRLAPFADYMVASQAEEPSSGWNYSFLEGIQDDENGGETGKRIVDAYFEVPQKTERDLTMACIDLSAIDEIEESMGSMYGQLSRNVNTTTFSSIANLRFAATGFGKADISVNGSNGYDLVDIVSLSESYSSMDEEGARLVREAVEKAVFHQRSNVDSSGLSAYHPFRNQNKFTWEWKNSYAQLGFCPGYAAYVNVYGSIMAGIKLARWDNLVNIRAEEEGRGAYVTLEPAAGQPEKQANSQGAYVTLKLTDDQLANMASARLVVFARNIYDEADDSYFRVFSTADVENIPGGISAWYDGSALQILNAAGYGVLTGAVSYQVTEQGNYVLKLYPFDEEGNRVTYPVLAEYVMDGRGQLVLKAYSFYDELLEAYTQRISSDLSMYSGITFLNDYRNVTINEEGEYPAFDLWDEDPHRDVQWKARQDIARTDFLPSFSQELSEAEELYAAFEITDTQGNSYTSEMVGLSTGGMTFHRFEESCVTEKVPDGALAVIDVWKEEHAIAAYLEFYNTSEEEQFYKISEIQLNGVPVDAIISEMKGGSGSPFSKRDIPCLKPGEAGSIILIVDEEMAEGKELGSLLETIGGKLEVYNPDGKLEAKVSFMVTTECPLNVLNGGEQGDEPETEFFDASIVTSWEEDNPYGLSGYVVMRPAKEAVNSKIIINVLLSNEGNEDVSFELMHISANGVPLKGTFTNAQGGIDSGRDGRGVPPGEKRAANLVLRYKDIEALMPDVSLTELTFDLKVYRDGEDDEILFMWPMELKMDISLDAFCQDAQELPSQDVVEMAREIGAFGADKERLLFEYGDIRLYLQGFFIVEKSAVLLLRAENASENGYNIYLGQAAIDGQKARMGKSTAPHVTVRNSRVRTFGADKEEWKTESGIWIELAPGETYRAFASVVPADESQQEMNTLSFHAMVSPKGNPLGTVYLDAIELRTEESAPLRPGFASVAPAEDFSIDGGKPQENNGNKKTVDEKVLVPEEGAPDPVLLTLEAPEGVTINVGYYAVFRRISSETALAEMNILNQVSSETYKPEISFANGKEWMVYVANGALTRAEDGKSATALFPCVYTAAKAFGESLPLGISNIRTGEDGRVYISQTEKATLLLSTEFPNAFVGYTGNINVAYDPETNEAELLSYLQKQEYYDDLAGLLEQEVSLLPARIKNARLLDFLLGEKIAEEKVEYQVQLLDRYPIKVAVEPIGDINDYVIFFLFSDTEGNAYIKKW